MDTRIVHFQVYERILYALDAQGTLWKNEHPPTSAGWLPIPGPTGKQHHQEDVEIHKRYQIDLTDNLP